MHVCGDSHAVEQWINGHHATGKSTRRKLGKRGTDDIKIRLRMEEHGGKQIVEQVGSVLCFGCESWSWSRAAWTRAKEGRQTRLENESGS